MRALTVFALLILVAAPAAAQEPEPEARPPRPLSRSLDVITLEEIQSLPDAQDAYEVVRRLRPTFLQVRRNEGAGLSRVGALRVYVNNAERGDVSTLRTIPVNGLLEIRRVSARDAMTRFGTDQNGVLLVTVGVMR
jgi:hypothetical protein